MYLFQNDKLFILYCLIERPSRFQNLAGRFSVKGFLVSRLLYLLRKAIEEYEEKTAPIMRFTVCRGQMKCPKATRKPPLSASDLTEAYFLKATG